MDKTKSQKLHAIKRLRQRYLLDKEDYRELTNLIKYQYRKQPTNIEFVGRESNRRTVWKVQYKGRNILLVYDSKRGNIVTFLHNK